MTCKQQFDSNTSQAARCAGGDAKRPTKNLSTKAVTILTGSWQRQSWKSIGSVRHDQITITLNHSTSLTFQVKEAKPVLPSSSNATLSQIKSLASDNYEFIEELLGHKLTDSIDFLVCLFQTWGRDRVRLPYLRDFWLWSFLFVSGFPSWGGKRISSIP